MSLGHRVQIVHGGNNEFDYFMGLVLRHYFVLNDLLYT